MAWDPFLSGHLQPLCWLGMADGCQQCPNLMWMWIIALYSGIISKNTLSFFHIFCIRQVLHQHRIQKWNDSLKLLISAYVYDAIRERWHVSNTLNVFSEVYLQHVNNLFLAVVWRALAASRLAHGRRTRLAWKWHCCPAHIIGVDLGSIYIEGILPKGLYLPYVSMAGRALLAGYPPYTVCSRYIAVTFPWRRTHERHHIARP